MAKDKLSATEDRERIVHAWLLQQRAEQYLGSDNLSFHDLPLGWQYQVTRENSVLFPLDEEALTQTLSADSPFELLADKLRVGSKVWLLKKLETLAILTISTQMDESTYAEECEKIRAQARRMYKEAEGVASLLDTETLEAFKAWREEHIHPWDKALDEYYECRQELIEKRGYGSLDEIEAIADYQLGLQPKAVVSYVHWMTRFDWILDLGSVAWWIESVRATLRSKG